MLYLVDSSGAIAAQYQYDEWGKITAVLNGIGTDVSADASHIANLNPLRYRGYYYDAETGLYYLQSRYYNPEWCRFISADELLDMNEHVFAANLYLYCRNNPIMWTKIRLKVDDGKHLTSFMGSKQQSFTIGRLEKRDETRAAGNKGFILFIRIFGVNGEGMLLLCCRQEMGKFLLVLTLISS